MKNISLFLMLLIVEGVFGETMSVSVKEGGSVTLNSDLTEIKKDDVIDWRFGDILIARVRNNNNASLYEDALDGKFRGRLKLNGQTGNLTITNTKTTDAGVYELSNSINTIKKTFNVTEPSPYPKRPFPEPADFHSGPSSGAAEGIVNAVVLLVAAAAAVIAT